MLLSLLYASGSAMSVVPAGGNVVCVGTGPIQALCGKLAATRGFQTTIAGFPEELRTAKQLIGDDSLPVTYLPIAGDEADAATIDAAINEGEGLIVAFDGEQGLPEGPMNIFLPPQGGTQIKHVSLMSRYLNGGGMMFTCTAAKMAANAEIWAGGKKAIEMYKGVEQRVSKRAADVGASYTIVRAGTLKGGAVGDPADTESGEPTFLDPFFYSLGQQDVVNWRLLFDCSSLGVQLTRGDTLPGPGFTAALTATAPEAGDGDSHRGAVASALVEALSSPAAADADFSVKSTASRVFPTMEEWAGMFDKVA